jgi:DNA-binding NarL/FixJ family response regulator
MVLPNDCENNHNVLGVRIALETPPIGTTSIVLADDHAMFREGTRRLLEEEPDLTVVGEAETGQAAVSVVRTLKPDLVVMDVVMPGLTGIEATREIKKSAPGTAVLILSAFDDDRYVLGLLEAGAAGYLLKSAGGHELVQAIRATVAGEAVLDPNVMARLLARSSKPATHATASEPGAERPTEREMAVLRLAGKGCGNKEIAAELALSVPTVKAHLVNIFNKMAVGSRTEAVLKAVRRGWMQMEDITPGTAPSPDSDAPGGSGSKARVAGAPLGTAVDGHTRAVWAEAGAGIARRG